jgi:hypothetical protein
MKMLREKSSVFLAMDFASFESQVSRGLRLAILDYEFERLGSVDPDVIWAYHWLRDAEFNANIDMDLLGFRAHTDDMSPLPSGLYFTSKYGNLANAIWHYICFQQLGIPSTAFVRGDDSVSIHENFLDAKACEEWFIGKGFKISPSKNMLSNTRTEFLRTIYTGDGIFQYYSRLISHVFRKPWSTEEFGKESLAANIFKSTAALIRRGGSSFRCFTIYQGWVEKFLKVRYPNWYRAVNSLPLYGGLGLYPELLLFQIPRVNVKQTAITTSYEVIPPPIKTEFLEHEFKEYDVEPHVLKIIARKRLKDVLMNNLATNLKTRGVKTSSSKHAYIAGRLIHQPILFETPPPPNLLIDAYSRPLLTPFKESISLGLERELAAEGSNASLPILDRFRSESLRLSTMLNIPRSIVEILLEGNVPSIPTPLPERFQKSLANWVIARVMEKHIRFFVPNFYKFYIAASRFFYSTYFSIMY